MLIIEGWFRMSAADVEKMKAPAAAMMAATKLEDGCFEYAFAQDLADPGIFRVVERWRDEAALASHFQTPHMADFQKAMAGVTMQGASVKLYDATLNRSLVGD